MGSLCDVTCRHTLHVASGHSYCADVLVDTYVTDVNFVEVVEIHVFGNQLESRSVST